MGETSKMAKPCMGLVLVEFGYEYENQDGCMVSIKPNERYMLLAKTNDHWWHVRKNECTKPFYIPAKYVKELPSSLPSPLDFVDVPAPKPPPAPLTASDLTEKLKSNEVTIRTRSPKNHRKTENRMSTFGVPLDIQEPPSYMYGGSVDPIISLYPLSASEPAKNKRHSVTPNLLLASHESSHKPRVPSLNPADILLRQAKPVEPPVFKNPMTTRPQLLLLKPEVLIEPGEESSPDKTPSSDSENIYESISDLHLENLVKTEPAVSPDPTQTPPSSALQGKERENPTMAVYANITELKKLTSRIPLAPSSTCSSPGLSLSPALDPPEWEGRPEQDNGKIFYSSSPHFQIPSLPAGTDVSAVPVAGVPTLFPLPSALLAGSDWERFVDDTTGRHYYYNAALNQTSWDAPEPLSPQQEEPPPLPEEDYPTNERKVRDTPLPPVKLPALPRLTQDPGTPVPPGWSCSTDPGGKTVFTSDHTHQQWTQLKDEKGKTYYYLKDRSVSQWNLPEVSVLGNGVEQDGLSVLKNWKPVPQDDMKFFSSHRRIASDHSTDSSSTVNSADTHQGDSTKLKRNLSSTDAPLHHHPQHHASGLEKAGILNKTKISDNGKKLRKNWAQSWTVLHGGILTFYKDPKSTPAGNMTKTNQIIPEFTVELKGAVVGWASKDKSSKKNVLEMKTRHGSEFLIQYDTDSIIQDWHKIIQDTIKHLDHDHYSEDEDDDVMEKSIQPGERERKNTTSRQSSSGPSDAEQSRVRTKLRKFLQRRPTLQSVKEKGYIKDNVFGCHLDTLCHRENTTVPRFVEKCIKSVERRGLNIDGIYRVSGNLAVIQKLRHKADHEENLDLEDGQWEEIHVITGALKLFFRELPEPLFPYSFFDKFIAAIQISDLCQRVSYMRDLVRALPLPNHNTMEVLFRHLRRVIDYSDSNRMSFQSMAIVFGPTLLRPEEESANMTIHMIFQNQIVELILNKFNDIFSPR